MLYQFHIDEGELSGLGAVEAFALGVNFTALMRDVMDGRTLEGGECPTMVSMENVSRVKAELDRQEYRYEIKEVGDPGVENQIYTVRIRP